MISMMTSLNGNIFRVTGPLCGEFTGPGEFPTQRPVTRSFDIFFDLRLNKRLSKQPWGWWFETPSWSLWRQCNDCEEITQVPFWLKWSYYHETKTCIVWYSIFLTRNGWCSIVRMISPIRDFLVQYSRQSSNIVNWSSCSMHARMSASCRDDLRSTHARVVTSWREGSCSKHEWGIPPRECSCSIQARVVAQWRDGSCSTYTREATPWGHYLHMPPRYHKEPAKVPHMPDW